MLKQTLTKTLMIYTVAILAISQFADAQNFNRDINEGLVLWNTLGSDSELQNSEVGPAVTSLQTLSYSAALNGFGIVSDNDDPVVQIPSSVLNIEEGTISLWIKLISVPTTYPNATEHLFLYTPENSLRFLSNDGNAHSGWFAHTGGSRLYSINSFGTTSTSSLGINDEEIFLTIRWDSSGVTGHGSEKLVFFRNDVKIGTYWETGSAWPANFSDDLLLNEARYNPTYASGTVDLDLIYDDIKMYNRSLSDQDVVDLYNGEIPVLETQSSLIVFNSNRDGNNEIYVMNPDGSNQTNLSNNSASDLYPTISPDGTKIVFSSDRDGDQEIYRMDADGSNLAQLTNNSFGDQGPVFSPDATKIAYFNYEFGRTEVFVMDADGTNQTRLTGNSGYVGWNYGAVWSPDGSRIAFRSDRGSNSNIWLMDAADGANLVNLTNSSPTWEEGPSWSPDGNSIAFHSQSSLSATDTKIWVIDIDGSNLTQLTSNPDYVDVNPCWSLDGSQIAFASNRNGDMEIFVMDSDGSNQDSITTNSGSNDFRPWWGAGITIVAPLLSTLPDSLAFGVVLVGETATKQVTVKNTGTADLDVSSITITGVDSLNFSVDTTNFTLAPDDSTVFDVNFTPDDTGSFNASLDIESNGGSASVVLTGYSFEIAGDYAMEFDGVDDYVNCGNDNSLDYSGGLTISAWIKFNEADTRYLIVSQNPGGYNFRIKENNEFTLTHWENWAIESSGANLVPDTWYHLAVTYDEQKVSFYKNGVVLNEVSQTGTITAGGTMYIGRYGSPAENWFNGTIDEVRIWNVARTQEEIQTEMSHHLDGDEEGLAGYWRVDEGSGPTLVDWSVSENHGQLGSTADVDANDPTWLETVWPNGIPELSASPDSIDFGDVIVEETTTEPVIVSNNGNADLTVSSIAITGDDAVNFSVAPVPFTTIPFTLVPGGSQILEISFTTDTVDSLSATLEIDGDGGSAGVALFGKGIAFPVLSVTPPSIDFGAIPEGDTATEQVTVTNAGTADLNVSSIAIMGADSSNFDVDTTTFTLAPADSQTIDVSFMPDEVGSYSATLEIESDSGSVSIALDGVGVNPIPLIISVVDIPEDQGGWVYLDWISSGYDSLGEITQYGIWELNPENEWISLGNVPAIQEDEYIYLAHTFGDSTEEGIFWSAFMVTAHTTDPEVFFESEVDSGYSVDNLAPAVPTGLLASATGENTVELSWDHPVDEDFNYFKIYRSLTPDFDPTGIEPFSETIDIALTDNEVEIGETYYYRLSAIDCHGNESEYSEAADATVLSTVDELDIPTEFALQQNFPNPFNPVTTIRYDLPEQSFVRLIIYDVLGREVRSLVNQNQESGFKSILWDAKDDFGKPVGAGVYLCRIEAGDPSSVSGQSFVQSNKMVLLK